MNVLVTGSTGFVGSRLADRLCADSQFQVTRAVRRGVLALDDRVFWIDGLDSQTDWSGGLTGQDTVVHVAARAHVVNDEASDPVSEYRKVNVDGTLNLARQAAKAGVQRFVFISSIKVNGEGNPADEPYTAEDCPAPEDAYGVSKMEAEQGLWDLSRKTGMDIVIIRPPLVYGPGVKGNFSKLMKMVERGVPLPLGAVHNKRSLVAVDNLVDMIVTCMDHPSARNQIFLAGDGRDLSTTELLLGIGKAVGKPARLVPVPPALLVFGAGLLGKKAIAQRVLGSLQVDINKARLLLGWQPPISVEEGLRRCFDPENTR